MQRNTLIFDFDGTIGDTFGLVVEIINANPRDFGIDGISPSEIPRLRSLSVPYLMKEFKIHIFQIPFYVAKIRRRLGKRMHEANLFPGFLELLQDLHSLGFNMLILSKNSQKSLNKFFDHNKIRHLFTRIYGNVGFFKKDNVLRKIMKENNLTPEAVLYVGDELHDILAAKDNNVAVCSVTWGYMSKELLEKANPTYMADNVSDLKDIISKHFT